VNERMLESYVIARDRFLAPDGKMFPTTGRYVSYDFITLDNSYLWHQPPLSSYHLLGYIFFLSICIIISCALN
jgi:hypothetical protein